MFKKLFAYRAPGRCVDTGSVPRRARTGAASAPLLLLAACAGAKITDISLRSPMPPPSGEIVVHAALAQQIDPSLQGVASALERRVVEDLGKRGVQARSASALPDAADGGVRLDLSIVELNRGAGAKRVIVGLGAGKSTLAVVARLSSREGTILDLTARATSGSKPGLILPGGATAATGKLLHLVVGSAIGIAADARGGTAGDVRNLSRVIARQVLDCHRSRDCA